MTGVKAIAVVARRRNRSEEIYKAAAQRLVTPATWKADRTSAGSGIEVALPTHTCLWRFSGRLAGILCKLSFAEFVEKIRIRWKRPLADF